MKDVPMDKIKDIVWMITKIGALVYASFQVGIYFNNLHVEAKNDKMFKVEAARNDSIILKRQIEIKDALEGLNIQNEIFVKGLIDMGTGHEKILKLQAKIIRESVKERPNMALIEQCEVNIAEIIEEKFPQYTIGVKPIK